MTEDQIIDLLNRFKNGHLQTDEVVKRFKDLPFEDLGFAMIDHHRGLRKGYPETIFSSGKTVEQVRDIALRMMESHSNNIMATRASKEVYLALKESSENVEYFEQARIVVINRKPIEKTKSKILVMSAGTSDIPVAEEAVVTAETMGNRVERVYDVGVAGIHRLLANRHRIDEASVLIVVAGMDGALPSVVAGLTDKPVIAVPTSVGYGASFGGVSALLTMLNSCACGVTVVNIDNGFGAGYSASVINKIANASGSQD